MPTLPGSSLEIFPVNLGGNAFGWTADEATSFEVLDRFVELGGTFVDTADSYAAWVDEVGGQSETIIGRWRAGRGSRDDVLIATKVARKPGREGLAHDNVVAALDFESAEAFGAALASDQGQRASADLSELATGGLSMLHGPTSVMAGAAS